MPTRARRLTSVSTQPRSRGKSRALLAGVADPDAVAAWSEDLGDAFLTCRDFGHTWKAFRAYAEGGGYVRILKCPRCKTEREQTLDRRGMVIASHYIYPEGYQAPKGSGRMDSEGRGALRLVSVMRQVEKVGA